MPCVSCQLNVSPSKKVICSGCNNYYHKICSKNYDVNNTLTWLCETCEQKHIIKRNISSRKHVKNNPNEKNGDSDINDLRNDISILLQKIDNLTITNIEIEKSVNFCSNKIDDYGKKIDIVFSKLKILEDKVNDINLKYNNLEKEFQAFKINNNNREQLSLTNNISVSGIPNTKNENVFEIIKATANVMNIKLKDDDIQYAFRTKANDTKDSKIITRFNNINIKESIMNELKLHYKNKQPLKANHINNILPDKLIYINHELTATNRKIFWLTKQFTNEYKWKYVWSHSSGIYVRKSDGDSAIKIQTINDLKKLDIEGKLIKLLSSGNNLMI